MLGVVKEVAPVPGAETDDVLGVGDFQSAYFNDLPLYLDADRHFYSMLGNRQLSLLSLLIPSWNPFTSYAMFKALGKRLQDKGIEGNLKGEGLLQGGVFVLHPARGVLYSYQEETGKELPLDDIRDAVRAAMA
mmetsp:Transcript_11779/g.39819  ORF Transcript_11779/g.39819 Transcript_11779/m.39819 type:complete len:133 (-) Transcript_11779:24-422(-)